MSNFMTRFYIFIYITLCWTTVYCAQLSNSTFFFDDFDDNRIEGRENEDVVVRGIFNILETFDLCSLKCKGKECNCCHRFLHIVPVCGNSFIDPKDKTLELNVKVNTRSLFQTKISLNGLETYCNTFDTNIGRFNICANATISDHQKHPDSFRVCLEAEIQLNQVKYFIVKFNCLEFDGDIVFESIGSKEAGKTIATTTILNPLHLAYILRKTISSSIFGLG